MLPHPVPPRFAPALEREFQANYYAANRPILRAVALLMSGGLCVVLFLSHWVPTAFDLPFNAPQIAFWLALFGLTFWRGFERVWQPVVALAAGAVALLVLNALAEVLVVQLGQKLLAVEATPSVIQQKFHFVMRTAILLVSLATLRLPARVALTLYWGVLAGAIAIFALRFPIPLPGFGRALFVVAAGRGDGRFVAAFLHRRRVVAARVVGQPPTRN